MQNFFSIRILKAIFISGLVIIIIIKFIPYSSTFEGGGYSDFNAIRYLIQSHMWKYSLWEFFSAIYHSTFTGIYLPILILALVFPRRWVFILGATIGALAFLYNLLELFEVIRESSVKYLIIPYLLSYMGYIFILTGFFIKPEKKG